MDIRLSVETKPNKSGVILKPNGVLTRSTLTLFKGKLGKIKLTPGQGLAVDFSRLEYIDSKGLGALLQLAESLSKKASKLYAYGMNPDIMSILECVDFNDNLTLLNDEKSFTTV